MPIATLSDWSTQIRRLTAVTAGSETGEKFRVCLRCVLSGSGTDANKNLVIEFSLLL